MVLTDKQEEGLRTAIARYRAGEKYVVISGYAGTGKSTLVKFIIEALDIDPNDVAYATYTGKAAEVLRKKGCPNAMTTHRLLYEFWPREGGGFYKKPKATLDYNVIVIDEISMLPIDMVELLFSHPVYVICLGDPFQLPPVEKDTANHLLDNPHVFLDQIMRQAEESDIIRMSMKIRNGELLQPYKGNDIQIVRPTELVTGMLTWADEVLVATNAKRVYYNNQIRALLNLPAQPTTGDKVICLRNYWDDCTFLGDPIVNGTIGILQHPVEQKIVYPYFAHTTVKSSQVINTSIKIGESDCISEVNIDKNLINGGDYSLDWRDVYKLGKLKEKYGDYIPREYAYGYAITTHKAQGSQWEKVLVLEERFPFDKIEHQRWLYTAVTRAEQKCVVVAANS